MLPVNSYICVMSQALNNALKQENLCTHFILPLLKLNKISFTSSGFVNALLTIDRAYRCEDRGTESSRKVLAHPDFTAIYKDVDGYYLVMFRLRDVWQKDVGLFCEGKYSQLSSKAKEYIIRYSGLPYHK